MKVVCATCKGEGQITPSGVFDGLDEKFRDLPMSHRDAYIRDARGGYYDVACPDCDGLSEWEKYQLFDAEGVPD